MDLVEEISFFLREQEDEAFIEDDFSVSIGLGCYQHPRLPNIDDYDHELASEWELGADVLDEEDA